MVQEDSHNHRAYVLIECGQDVLYRLTNNPAAKEPTSTPHTNVHSRFHKNSILFAVPAAPLAIDHSIPTSGGRLRLAGKGRRFLRSANSIISESPASESASHGSGSASSGRASSACSHQGSCCQTCTKSRRTGQRTCSLSPVRRGRDISAQCRPRPRRPRSALHQRFTRESPCLASLRTGWERPFICLRIWCHRPVLGRATTREERSPISGGTLSSSQPPTQCSRVVASRTVPLSSLMARASVCSVSPRASPRQNA
mmetsp:Transcript_52081/g.111409  ORF Transcript_52081/g.111409 Transcript_52081/m.111409 type:complete len:256 (+) Transcript_52081:131-898(+)